MARRIWTAVIVIVAACGSPQSRSTEPKRTPEERMNEYSAGGGPSDIDWGDWSSWTPAQSEPIPSEGHGETERIQVYLRPEYAHKYEEAAAKPPGFAAIRVSLDKKDEAIGLAGMAKMAPGYDSANSNWYYVNLTGDARILEEGPLGKCITCHREGDRDGMLGSP